MKEGHDTTLHAAIVVTLGVVAVFLTLFFLPASNGGAPLLPATSFIVDPVEARYSYQDDLQIYEGSIALPESCMRLMARGAVEDEEGNVVTLSFDTAREESVECERESREQTFYIAIAAPADAQAQATFNGRAVSLNLTDATADEETPS